jgi:hypothetical protein
MEGVRCETCRLTKIYSQTRSLLPVLDEQLQLAPFLQPTLVL